MPGYLQVLAQAQLYLPGFRDEPVTGTATQRLLSLHFENQSYLVVFTSTGALYEIAGTRVDGWRPVTLSELAASWPADQDGLAVSPGLPIGTQLSRDQVLAVAGAVAAQPPFEPAGPVEELMLRAVRAADPGAYLALLASTALLVPVRDGVLRPGRDSDGPYLAVFTSRQRLADAGPVPDQVAEVDLATLAGTWPDPACRLVVNPGTAIEVAWLGALVPDLPGLVDLGTAPGPSSSVGPSPSAAPSPSAGPGTGAGPVAGGAGQHVQVAVDAVLAGRYLDTGYARVSGLVQAAFTGPAAGTAPGTSAGATPAYLVRWTEPVPPSPRAGSPLAPGTGLAEHVLPSGAALWYVDDAGGQRLIATYHEDLGRWIPAVAGALRGWSPGAPDAGTPDSGIAESEAHTAR